MSTAIVNSVLGRCVVAVSRPVGKICDKDVSVARCMLYPTAFVVQRSMFPDYIPDKVFLPLRPLPEGALHERR